MYVCEGEGGRERGGEGENEFVCVHIDTYTHVLR